VIRDHLPDAQLVHHVEGFAHRPRAIDVEHDLDVVAGPAIGILCSLLAIELPSVVVDSLKLLGNATPGVSLFCLGLIMSAVELRPSREVWENAVLKLLAQPALMVGAAVLLSVSGGNAQQMILLCALPSATISGMFANEAGVYRDEAATSILVSSILSLITFSLAIYLIDLGLGAA